MSRNDSIAPAKKPIRQRAPRRTGRRAQLTVPEDMWRQLTQIARAAGTTPNDALVRLASERLDDHQRTLALQQRADKRWRAFVAEAPVNETVAAPLSEEELVELSGAFRADT
jgi:predicted DNA-binding ribbon-helix-helix protein